MKIELLIFTKNNEVILVSQTDDDHIKDSVTSLIDKYSLTSFLEFDSIEEMILELHSLGVNTTVFKLDLSDLITEEDE